MQGSVENAIKLTKKVIPKGLTCSVFQWLRLMDFTEFTLNNWPIGVQSDMEVLTPNSFKPIHSNSTPLSNPGVYSLKLARAKEKFARDWFQLYYTTILHQNKWTDSTANFTVGDLVLVLDLKGVLSYPVLGRVKFIEQDTDGGDRYFVVEYKRGKSVVISKDPDNRPAASLVFIHANTSVDDILASEGGDQTGGDF